jgi:DME family drug/metabolite transporter
MRTPSPIVATLLVLGAASLFSLLGISSRTAYAMGLDPVSFVAWRAGLAAVAIAAVDAMRRGRPGMLEILRGASTVERRGLAAGIVAATTLNLLLFSAFSRTTIALALLAFYTYPALVAAASAVLGREPMDRSRAVALVLAMAGMVAVVAGGLTAAGPGALKVDALGIAFGFGAALCQVVFVLAARDYHRLPADQAMGWILGLAGIASAALAVLLAGPGGLLLPFGDPALLGLLTFVGVFSAAIPSLVLLLGIRWIGPVRTGIAMLWEPVMGLVIAALFLAEPLAPLQVLGGGLVLLAALLAQRAPTVEPELDAAVAPIPGGP